MRAIAQRLGVGDYFAAEPADYLADILAETPGFTADSFADLRREGVLRRSPAVVQRVAHADRRFATPTGRVEFYVERLLPYGRALPDYEPPAEACSEGALREQFPLVCITEHSLYRVHSTFVNAPWLREMDAEPVALLHPSEGAARGVADRDIVRVFNERGYVVLRAHLDEAVPAGTVYFTQGWQTDDFLAGHPQTLTHGRTNPANAFGPNSSFSDVLVQVVKGGLMGHLKRYVMVIDLSSASVVTRAPSPASRRTTCRRTWWTRVIHVHAEYQPGVRSAYPTSRPSSCRWPASTARAACVEVCPTSAHPARRRLRDAGPQPVHRLSLLHHRLPVHRRACVHRRAAVLRCRSPPAITRWCTGPRRSRSVPSARTASNAASSPRVSRSARSGAHLWRPQRPGERRFAPAAPRPHFRLLVEKGTEPSVYYLA